MTKTITTVALTVPAVASIWTSNFGEVCHNAGKIDPLSGERVIPVVPQGGTPTRRTGLSLMFGTG